MVLSWLLNSLDENIRNSVLYFDTAKDLWKGDLDNPTKLGCFRFKRKCHTSLKEP